MDYRGLINKFMSRRRLLKSIRDITAIDKERISCQDKSLKAQRKDKESEFQYYRGAKEAIDWIFKVRSELRFRK